MSDRVKTSEEVAEPFEHKILSGYQVDDMDALRELFISLAMAIEDRIVDGRAKSLAVTKLEEAQMWANKAISRH